MNLSSLILVEVEFVLVQNAYKMTHLFVMGKIEFQAIRINTCENMCEHHISRVSGELINWDFYEELLAKNFLAVYKQNY